MKKNRPAVRVTVVAPPALGDSLARLLLAGCATYAPHPLGEWLEPAHIHTQEQRGA